MVVQQIHVVMIPRFGHWTTLTQFTGDAYLQSMMGHGLRAASHAELTQKLVQRGFLVGPEHVIQAFAKTDRSLFCPPNFERPFDNIPVKLNRTHAMSTPQLHAQIISLLAPMIGPGKVVAEVGAGSGFIPAVMANGGCGNVIACDADADARELCSQRTEAPVEVVSDLPTNIVYDAMYISPFFKTERDMMKFLSSHRFSDDALVVGSYGEADLGGQQLCLLEHSTGESGWHIHELFRVMGEPISV